MPQVTGPHHATTHTVVTQTREGEVTVKLVIELNLNLNGQVSAVAAEELSVAPTRKPEDKVDWMIPDFNPSTEKIEFGKYEK